MILQKSNPLKTAVTHKGFQEKVAPISGVSNHDLPSPDKLREGARIQLKVQNRLKQVADQARLGTKKLNRRWVGLLRSLSKIESSGPMSL